MITGRWVQEGIEWIENALQYGDSVVPTHFYMYGSADFPAPDFPTDPGELDEMTAAS